MRKCLALLMLVLLGLSSAAPACARAPTASAHHMDHRPPMPGHCDGTAAAHDCPGCATELPDPPRVAAILWSVALRPVAHTPAALAGRLPLQPLRPPRA